MLKATDMIKLKISATNTLKTKIMASGPVTPWQIDGETMETVRDFVVTAAMKLKDTCSLEEKI